MNDPSALNLGSIDLLCGLRQRWPKSAHALKHQPTPGCRRCKGTGIEPARNLTSGRRMHESPCACLFFGPETEVVTKWLDCAARSLSSHNNPNPDNTP